MGQTSLPPGFRFHPTDVELVSYYLKRKIMGKKLLVQAISEVDLYKFAPWDLPDKSCLRSRDLEWFFFCPRDKKYPNGSRTNRGTPNGYWKTSGKDRIIKLNSLTVGLKKTLIFHEGKAPKGKRTDWVMYEYKMEDDDLVSAGFSKDDYVICKIFKKSGLGPRIGEQYGAPFNEDDFENLDVEAYMFPLSTAIAEEPLVHSSAATAATVTIEEPLVEHSSAATATTSVIVEEPLVQHSSAATATTSVIVEEPLVQHSSAAAATTSVNHLGYMTTNCTLQDLPSQQSVISSGDVNNISNEVNNAPPEIDGDLLDELSMFLNDSPNPDIPFGEHSGLPSMSELEAQAFEINTCDLYNELAGLARFGDDFCASNVGVTENNFRPLHSELAISDDYLELDDLLSPGATFSYDFPVPDNQFLQYPLDQSTYNGQYDDSAILSSTVIASGSLPTIDSMFADLPSVSNNNGFTADLVNPNYSDPTMNGSLS